MGAWGWASPGKLNGLTGDQRTLETANTAESLGFAIVFAGGAGSAIANDATLGYTGTHSLAVTGDPYTTVNIEPVEGRRGTVRCNVPGGVELYSPFGFVVNNTQGGTLTFWVKKPVLAAKYSWGMDFYNNSGVYQHGTNWNDDSPGMGPNSTNWTYRTAGVASQQNGFVIPYIVAQSAHTVSFDDFSFTTPLFPGTPQPLLAGQPVFQPTPDANSWQIL